MATWSKVVVESSAGKIAQTASGINDITLGDLAELDSVAAGQIDTGAVGASEIAAGAVNASELATDAVTTVKILADAVDGTKIADDSIDSEHIASGAINAAAMIADNVVSLAKMAGITKGSIIYGDNSDNPAYLTIGATGKALVSDGSQMSWGDVSTVGSIDDLDDVDTTSEAPEVNDLLAWNGSNWVAEDIATANLQSLYDSDNNNYVVVTNGTGKLDEGLTVTEATLELLNGITIGETYCPPIDANTSFLMNHATSVTGEAKWASISCLGNAIGTLLTMNFGNALTASAGLNVTGATATDGSLTVTDGSFNVKDGADSNFTVAYSSGDTNIEGELTVAGDCDFQGIVTIAASEDISTNDTTMTLNADSGGLGDSTNSGIIIDIDGNVDGSEDPRLFWKNDTPQDATLAGTGWYVDSQTKTGDGSYGELAIMGMHVVSGTPDSNDTPHNQGTFAYNTADDCLYICTNATYIAP